MAGGVEFGERIVRGLLRRLVHRRGSSAIAVRRAARPRYRWVRRGGLGTPEQFAGGTGVELVHRDGGNGLGLLRRQPGNPVGEVVWRCRSFHGGHGRAKALHGPPLGRPPSTRRHRPIRDDRPIRHRSARPLGPGFSRSRASSIARSSQSARPGRSGLGSPAPGPPRLLVPRNPLGPAARACSSRSRASSIARSSQSARPGRSGLGSPAPGPPRLLVPRDPLGPAARACPHSSRSTK